MLLSSCFCIWLSKEAATGGVLQTCNFIKKETPTQVLSCEIYDIFKNTYFEEYLRMTAPVSKLHKDKKCFILFRHEEISYPVGIYLLKLTLETLKQGVKYVQS